MTRDEAKKLAEEWAETKHPTDRIPNFRKKAAVEAWMACYDALTKGEPDGYCAWHPFTQGWTHDESRSLHLYKHIQGAEYDLKDLSSRFERNLDKDRWTIVPVKILEVQNDCYLKVEG